MKNEVKVEQLHNFTNAAKVKPKTGKVKEKNVPHFCSFLWCKFGVFQ